MITVKVQNKVNVCPIYTEMNIASRWVLKPCSHIMFASTSNVKNGYYGSKRWCLHSPYPFSRTGWQRSKKNANADVTCECT